MDKWRSSAAFRIAVAFAAVFAMATVVLGTFVYVAMHIAFTRQLDAMIADDARALVTLYNSDDRSELADAIAERERSSARDRLMYAVFAPSGRQVMGSLQTARPAPGFHDLTFTTAGGEQDLARGLAVDLAPDRRLVVAADREWIERIDRTILTVFAVGFLAVCALGVSGALILGAYLRRRLRPLTNGARAIIAGDRKARMPVSARRDEFDQLALALNAMLERTEGLLDNLRDVTSGVAHELRTPLSRLRNRLESGAAVVGAGGPAAKHVIDDAIRDIDDVLALFAAVLRIAEVESGETSRLFEPFDMSLLATELAESFAPAIRDSGRTMLWSVEPGLAMLGDRELIAQAGANLLENARLHTPPATLVRLDLLASSDTICLRVSDNGPGVPKDERGAIVERFKRLEGSRGKAGHGLGLNLVNAIARLHRGRLVIGDCGPGLSATIELPRSPPGERP